MTLQSDVQKGWHDAIVEMFDLDLSLITGDSNDKFYFTNQLKPDDSKIQWKGNTYEPLPILATGYEKNTTGQIAQPSLTVANVLGTFASIIDPLDDLVGAKVTRRRTLGKYLDGEPGADSTQEFPIDIYYIERKTSENALSITWQLASIFDLEGLKLPRRVITQNYCQWRYRSSECGYTGAPVYDVNDNLISTSGQSAEAIAVINAHGLVLQRRDELKNAIAERDAAAAIKQSKCGDTVDNYTLNQSQYERESSPEYYVEFEYESEYDSDPSSVTAIWNNSVVDLGKVYREGTIEETVNGPNEEYIRYHRIEEWVFDAAACSTATSDLATKEAVVSTAQSNLSAAESALNVAVGNLPASDPLWNSDVCGKRTESCSLRFPDSINPPSRTSLPFGGFPGAINPQ